MLVRLFGKNFRSLKNKFDLSLVAADLTRKEDSDRGVIKVRISGMSEPVALLRCVAIYGANASGKSTVLTAVRALRWLVTSSSQKSNPGEDIPPYEPFRLDKTTQHSAIELGCDVAHDSSILRYEITYGKRAIRTEKLTVLTGDKQVLLIDRRPSGETRGELIACSDANKLYVKEMQPNVTVLSKLAQHGPQRGRESVQPYYRAIRNATRYADYSMAAEMFIRLGGSDERFADDPEYRQWIMHHLMRCADVGICDVKVRREAFNVPQQIMEILQRTDSRFTLSDPKRVVVSFVHEGETNASIEFEDESSGTKKLFNIASNWWTLANKPVTLFADELSASLHPRLLDRLIRGVNDAPERVRSQLVFATHDVGLLESQDGQPPALRRDQIYFTRKDARGATELYSLAEFREDARPVHNIRKRYMSGLYGAIPSVEKLTL